MLYEGQRDQQGRWLARFPSSPNYATAVGDNCVLLVQMWKAVVGHDVSVKVEAQGDDWDTDPDFVVSV